jgi:ParB/RepB/Spo0J family partition protein
MPQKLRHVDPRKIHIPATRVTAVMDEETTAQFEQSVATIGIDDPIKVYEVEGELWLSDGLHRLQQAIKLNMPLVDVTVREGTMVDVLCNNLMSGHLRGKHPLSQMVKVIAELWKTYQLGSDEIAKKTGLSREHVEDIMLISDLTPMVRQAVDDGVLNMGQAKALTRIKDPVGQETVYGQWQLARWSAKELNEFVSQVIQLHESHVEVVSEPAPVTEHKLTCFYCGKEIPLEQLKTPNTCIECAGILLGAINQAKAEATSAAVPKTE